MATKQVNIEQQIAEKHVAPVILKLLNPYSATEMAQAINENVNLAKGLKQDQQLLGGIKLLLIGVPFVDKLGKKLKQKKWIDWFVETMMQKERPDLYNQIVYHPKGKRYIRKEVRKIVKLLFG
jgi:hypothetical protein